MSLPDGPTSLCVPVKLPSWSSLCAGHLLGPPCRGHALSPTLPSWPAKCVPSGRESGQSIRLLLPQDQVWSVSCEAQGRQCPQHTGAWMSPSLSAVQPGPWASEDPLPSCLKGSTGGSSTWELCRPEVWWRAEGSIRVPGTKVPPQCAARGALSRYTGRASRVANALATLQDRTGTKGFIPQTAPCSLYTESTAPRTSPGPCPLALLSRRHVWPGQEVHVPHVAEAFLQYGRSAVSTSVCGVASAVGESNTELPLELCLVPSRRAVLFRGGLPQDE